MRVLLSLACVLTLATSASAECAWVVWGVKAEPNAPGGVVAIPLDSATSREGCEQQRLQWEAKAKSKESHYICLPDTVDPRGPRGT